MRAPVAGHRTASIDRAQSQVGAARAQRFRRGRTVVERCDTGLRGGAGRQSRLATNAQRR